MICIRRNLQRRNAFTLIELLVVIAIIGVLVALLIPAVQKVREAANRAACQNNLKQLGLALQHYHCAHETFPPAKVLTSKTLHGLFPFVFPYIEQMQLYEQYDFTTTWNHPGTNEKSPGGPNQAKLKTLICPAAPPNREGPNGRGITDYSATAVITSGNNFVTKYPPFDPTFVGVLGFNVGRRIAEVTDGTTCTLMMVEDAGREQIWKMGKCDQPNGTAGSWADPDNTISVTGFDPEKMVSKGPCAVNCWNDNDAYGFHPAGAHGLFADGSVRILRAGLDINLMVALVTRNQGDLGPCD